MRENDAVATVLTACGIETLLLATMAQNTLPVATVLTACGIETTNFSCLNAASFERPLQQYLPLAVLKLTEPGFKLPASTRCNSTYRLRY